MGKNKNYTRSRAKEYRVMEQLRKEGKTIVGRAAGSHGPFDVWGMTVPSGQEPGRMTFVQVKTGKTQEQEKARAMDGLKSLAGVYEVTVEVR